MQRLYSPQNFTEVSRGLTLHTQRNGIFFHYYSAFSGFFFSFLSLASLFPKNNKKKLEYKIKTLRNLYTNRSGVVGNGIFLPGFCPKSQLREWGWTEMDFYAQSPLKLRIFGILGGKGGRRRWKCSFLGCGRSQIWGFDPPGRFWGLKPPGQHQPRG